MVLADLGKRINTAVNSALSNTQDDYVTTVDVMLKSIVTALLESDVNIKLVFGLRNNIRVKLAFGKQEPIYQQFTDQETNTEDRVRRVMPLG